MPRILGISDIFKGSREEFDQLRATALKAFEGTEEAGGPKRSNKPPARRKPSKLRRRKDR